MEKVIYKKNKMIVIDKDKLKPHGRSAEVLTALYAEIYTEFQGATQNPIYKHLDNLRMLEEVNKFAYQWLKSKGYI